MWSSRNSFIHSGNELCFLNIVSWASSFLDEFRAAIAPVDVRLVSRCKDVKLKPPNAGVFKINTDAGVDALKGRTGISVIIAYC
ncbi:hypothetical protein ACOSP7_017858 [Xanthoceras sorbifolium]